MKIQFLKIFLTALNLMFFISCGESSSDKVENENENEKNKREEAANIDSGYGQASTSIRSSDFENFKQWTSVIKSREAFKSPGHGGVLVNMYFDEKASGRYMGSSSKFEEGAFLVKERLDSSGKATGFIYLMKKTSEKKGDDLFGWVYGTATQSSDSGTWSISQDQSKSGNCISCHNKYTEHEGADSLRIYQEQ